jgi:multidrug efflux system outer membrane protein
LSARNEAVNAATQTAESAKNRHDSGLASYFEFIDAERERLQARLAENSLIGERQAAAVNLIQALGGIW